jgi:hypothetical protein
VKIFSKCYKVYFFLGWFPELKVSFFRKGGASVEGMVYEIIKIYSEKFIQIIPKIIINFRIPPNLSTLHSTPHSTPHSLPSAPETSFTREINPNIKPPIPEK